MNADRHGRADAFARRLAGFARKHVRDFGTLGFLVVFMIIMAIRHDEFLDLGDITGTANIHLSILKQASLRAIVAAGMTMIIILAGIDLSVASVTILSACVAAGLMVKTGLPVPAAFLVGIMAGAALGAVNGFLSSWGGLPPFIATLGMMSVARGAAYLFCNRIAQGTTIWGLPAGGRAFNHTFRLGAIRLPLPFLLVVVVFVATYVVLTRTKLGRYTYAIGANEEVARLAGIPVNRIKLIVFTIGGALCALSGFIYIGMLDSANAEGLVGFELDVIASVVIGGTSLMGGEGKVTGSLVGAVLIAYIHDGLTREGAATEWSFIVIGLIIVAAVGFDNLMKTGRLGKLWAGIVKLERKMRKKEGGVG